MWCVVFKAGYFLFNCPRDNGSPGSWIAKCYRPMYPKLDKCWASIADVDPASDLYLFLAGML